MTSTFRVLYVLVSNRRRELESTLDEAIVQGALARLRSVILMMLVAMLGIVPAAIATGVGSDVQRPLATVLMGGLLSALVLVMGALPAAYKLVAPSRA